MSSVVISGDTSGAITLAAPAVAGTNTLSLPALTGTVLTNKTAGAVLQVVSVSKSDVFSSSTTTTYTDVTGLSVTITPSSASNKILVLADIFVSNSDNSSLRLLRDSTVIAAGTATGSQTQSSFGDFYSASNTFTGTQSLNFLDSPSTTSAITYKIQFWIRGGTAYINANYSNGNFNYVFKPTSNITLMEIAA